MGKLSEGSSDGAEVVQWLWVEEEDAAEVDEPHKARACD